MRFKGLAAAVIAAALAATGYALADVNYTQGTGTVIYDFTCFVSKHCSAHVPIDSAGCDMTDTTNHRLNTNTNTADGSNVAVGAKAETAWTGTGSGSVIGILKAIYSAATGAVPAGTNV